MNQNKDSQKISSKRIGEEYFKVQHPSGLKMLLYPMQGFSTACAMFVTKYGSVDTCFKTKDDADFVQVPGGIAHYLEHKLFESEDGDAFDRFAKTGASANAFTTLDKTAYYFNCSDNFSASLEILLDFVTDPYFTKETVEKEQGIIGQEIRMYDDDPHWQVSTNLLQSLYVKHPVRDDIAGTVESIAKINADLLYHCYNTFYNLNNMVLAVAGNFKVEEVIAAADKILKKAPEFSVKYPKLEEPVSVNAKEVQKQLPVSTPLFEIGFKSVDEGELQNFKNTLLDEMLLDIITGETSELYHELTSDGLINSGLSGGTLQGRDYLTVVIGSESKDPRQVYKRVCDEIIKMQKNGIDNEAFNRTKKATYGSYVGLFSKPEATASIMVNSYFSGLGIYDLLDLSASVTKEQLENRLKTGFVIENSALSIASSLAL